MNSTSFSRESVLRAGLTVWGWPNLGSFMASFSLAARPPISMCSATSSPVITCSCAGVTRVNKVPFLLRTYRCPGLMQPSAALYSYSQSKRHGLVLQLHTMCNVQDINAGRTYTRHCSFSTCEIVSGLDVSPSEAGAEAPVLQERQ